MERAIYCVGAEATVRRVAFSHGVSSMRPSLSTCDAVLQVPMELVTGDEMLLAATAGVVGGVASRGRRK